MTTRSTAKKTLRNFQARSALWLMFEKRAVEMECSVDYLINEAMRLYATTHELEASTEVEDAQAQQATEEMVLPAGPKPTVSQRSVKAPSLPRPGGAGAPGAAGGGPGLPRPGGLPSPPRPSSPPPMPPRPVSGVTGTGATGSGAVDQRPLLMLVFEGNKVPIKGDQFIIGRSAKSSDLPIKDANISRKHAAIIYHNGAYYMKDLGSTNGIDFKGQPVDSKRIDEGDVFSVCGHDLHFTYQA